MKREMHYCDRCGAQMTAQDKHSNDVIGFTVPSGFSVHKYADNGGVITSSAGFLRGTEFCSELCLVAALREVFNCTIKQFDIHPSLLNDSRTTVVASS